MNSDSEHDSALYGIKLYVDRYGAAVIDVLNAAGVQVIQSPTCFKVIHTSFRGSLNALFQRVPELSHYPIKQYTWWRKISTSIKRD